MESTIVTGVTLRDSVLTVRQNNGQRDIEVDLSTLDDATVNGGSYNSGVLTLNVEGGSNIQIPLQRPVDLIANRVTFDTNNSQMTFSSDGGGNLFSVDLSSLKDNEDNLVADRPDEGQVDVVTEDELTDRIRVDFTNQFNTRIDPLI